MKTSMIATALLAPLALAGTAAAQPRYLGQAVLKQDWTRTIWRTGKTKTSPLVNSGRGSLSYDVKGGVLRIDMTRPGERAWSQSFVIDADTTATNGVRTIEYSRPEPGSALARQNLAALNLSGVQKIMGGFRAMEGKGVLLTDGNQVRWTNVGRSDLRIGWKRGVSTWNETFSGVLVR